MGRNRRKRAGVTLIELMVTAILMVLLVAAVTSAFVAGLDIERRQIRIRAEHDQTREMEERISALLQGARLSANTQDRTAYFIGNDANVGMASLATGGVGSATASNGTLNTQNNQTSDSSGDLGCTRLIFTTVAPDIPIRARNDSDDFETQYQKHGPLGGMAEVSYSMNAVGDAGDKTGLFERFQRPGDGDPGQGGTERLINANLYEIGFQFWNGTSWTPTWDTTSGIARRLPAAVQVNYILKNDPQKTVRQFVVPIPASDVTTQNPVANATGGTP